MGRGRRPVAWEKALVVLAEHPSACYFRDRWNQWWRVYDGKFCPPYPDARSRCFVDRDGRRYRYTFKPDEDRTPTPKALLSQQEHAERIRQPRTEG